MKIKKLNLVFVLFILFITSAFAKGYAPIENVKSFRFQVQEENFSGKNQRELKYEVLVNLPDQFKKIVSFPEMNAGEVYLYKGEEKKVYLPIFDQVKTSKIEGNENEVFKMINSLIKKLKTDQKFKKKYYAQEKITFDLDKTYKIELNHYLVVDNYVFPSEWSIQENGTKIMDLHITEVQIAPKFSEKDFQIP